MKTYKVGAKISREAIQKDNPEITLDKKPEKEHLPSDIDISEEMEFITLDISIDTLMFREGELQKVKIKEKEKHRREHHESN